MTPPGEDPNRRRPGRGGPVGWFFRLFHLKRSDLPKLAKLWSLYVLLSCGTEVAKLVAEVLFVSRAGIRWLPSLFVFQALTNTLASVGYVAMVKRWKGSAVFVALLAGFGVVMVTASLGVNWTGGVLPYALLFGCAEAGATLLKIHWGVHILEIYDPKSASRVFPFLFTGAALGRSAGGAAVRGGAALLGLPLLLTLTIVCTVPLSLFLLWTRRQRPYEPDTAKGPARSLLGKKRSSVGADDPASLFVKKPPRQNRKKDAEKTADDTDEPPSSGQDPYTKTPEDNVEELSTGAFFQQGAFHRIRMVFRVLFSSKLIKAMMISTALMVMMRHVMRYGSLVVLQRGFDETALAGTLGTYALAANLAGIALQLFFTPRLLKRFGVEAANLLYAGSITVGITTLALTGTVSSALLTRFFHSEFKGAVRTPISPIFYFGEPSHRRAEARAFILGGVVPVFTVISGILLQCASDLVDVTTMAWTGTGLGVFYALACVWQNRVFRKRIQARPPSRS